MGRGIRSATDGRCWRKEELNPPSSLGRTKARRSTSQHPMTTAAPPTVTNLGEDIILSSIDVTRETFEGSFEESYEIEATLLEIERGGYCRVSRSLLSLSGCGPADTMHDIQIGLQFPDELLHDATPIFRAIRNRLGLEKELYILADTTYGR